MLWPKGSCNSCVGSLKQALTMKRMMKRERILAIFEADVHEYADEDDKLIGERDFAEKCVIEGAVADSGGTPTKHSDRGVGAQNVGLWVEWEKFAQEVEDDCTIGRPLQLELLRNDDRSCNSDLGINEADGFW